jgi:putative phosphoribosyl transferase
VLGPVDGFLLADEYALPIRLPMRTQQPFSAPVPPAVTSAREVRIPASSITLIGELTVPADCNGVVLFAHGSGSSRHSARDRAVAAALRSVARPTLLFDLRTPQEESMDRMVGWLQHDPLIPAQRLGHATVWIKQQPELQDCRVGYFGSDTGAAAALLAASALGTEISAVVCRGGRPDLVEECLSDVETATLLLVADQDPSVLERNREAMDLLGGQKELAIITGATHQFREKDVPEQVASLASTWFRSFLAPGVEVH